MPEEKLNGVVSFISHSVDPATRTARVRIEVDNKDGELRPGMFGSVEIVGGGDATGQAVLAVPDEAVQTVEGGPAVFVPVKGEENTFAKRPVTVGRRVGGMVPEETSGRPVGWSMKHPRPHSQPRLMRAAAVTRASARTTRRWTRP